MRQGCLLVCDVGGEVPGEGSMGYITLWATMQVKYSVPELNFRERNIEKGLAVRQESSLEYRGCVKEPPTLA
jgi:hypothetical protein